MLTSCWRLLLPSPGDGDGDGDGARVAPLPLVPSAASLPHAGEKPATSPHPTGCHPAGCHRRGDNLPVPCPAMPGAGGRARCRRGRSGGKRAAGCGAQISGCLSSSRCCGCRAGGRKRRTIGGPVAASPRGLRRDPAAAASPPRRSPGTARGDPCQAAPPCPRPHGDVGCPGAGTGPGHLPAWWLELPESPRGGDSARWPHPKQAQSPQPRGDAPVQSTPQGRDPPGRATHGCRGQPGDSRAVTTLPRTGEMATATSERGRLGASNTFFSPSGFPLAAAGPRSLASPVWGSRCHRRPPASHLGAISTPGLPNFRQHRGEGCGGAAFRGSHAGALARGGAARGQWVFPDRIPGPLGDRCAGQALNRARTGAGVAVRVPSRLSPVPSLRGSD